MTLELLLERLEFNEVIEKVIVAQFLKKKHKIDELADEGYKGELPDFPLCRRKPLTRLIVIVALLLKKYEEYRKLKVPEEIIIDTFKDVSLRAEQYLKKNHKAGLYKADVIWFRHLMKAEIFKLGCIQFQPFKMVYLDELMEFESMIKERLPIDAWVINCHIQHGTTLSRRSMDESFEKAVLFFGEILPTIEFRAFLCYSWLLYPKMTSRLREGSNIGYFANKFEIIGQCNDNAFAKEYLFPFDKKHLTFLQRLFINDKECFGFACGIKMLR